jgi:translation initiation factor IF-2
VMKACRGGWAAAHGSPGLTVAAGGKGETAVTHLPDRRELRRSPADVDVPIGPHQGAQRYIHHSGPVPGSSGPESTAQPLSLTNHTIPQPITRTTPRPGGGPSGPLAGPQRAGDVHVRKTGRQGRSPGQSGPGMSRSGRRAVRAARRASAGRGCRGPEGGPSGPLAGPPRGWGCRGPEGGPSGPLAGPQRAGDVEVRKAGRQGRSPGHSGPGMSRSRSAPQVLR